MKTLHLLKLRARLCEPRDRGKSDLVEDMEVMMYVVCDVTNIASRGSKKF